MKLFDKVIQRRKPIVKLEDEDGIESVGKRNDVGGVDLVSRLLVRGESCRSRLLRGVGKRRKWSLLVRREGEGVGGREGGEGREHDRRRLNGSRE